MSKRLDGEMTWEEVLVQLKRNCGRFAEKERARTAMVRCVDFIPRRLPEVVMQALRTAKDFGQGRASEAELERARVACWQHLRPHDCDFADPDVCAVRAAICALFPVVDEPFDYLSTCLEFAESAGAADSDLSAVLREVYYHAT